MKENFETKKGKVKAWLLSGKAITSQEAINMWWCTRLAAVIKDLEDRDGLTIDRVRVYEGRNNYTRYWLHKEE